jgi:putative transposase
VKFGFVAKHRGIWPAEWLCEALGVSRGGFYAWLTRPRSQRSRSDEDVGAKVRASFLASDRTYGARRVWHDLLAEGVRCGLHRIERLMRLQALKTRPRRRRLPPDLGERQAAAVAPNALDRSFEATAPTANGSPTLPMSGRPRDGSMCLPSSICSRGEWSEIQETSQDS